MSRITTVCGDIAPVSYTHLQMETMGSHYIVFNYGVTKDSLDEIRAIMEQRRK